MADIYGFKSDSISSPITADKCIVQFNTQIATAVNVAIQYNQQINRRRVVGDQSILLWASAPQGQASIQTMIVGQSLKTAGASGWQACRPGVITFTMGSCTGGGPTISCHGAVVSSYSLSAEVEGLTVMENVVIDFVSLS
jgi:hypothetical protein